MHPFDEAGLPPTTDMTAYEKAQEKAAAHADNVEKAVETMRVQADAHRQYLTEIGAFGLFDPSRVGTIAQLAMHERHADRVEGVLRGGELTLLFADSYVGKSFLALDWGLSIAHGIPWQGRQTTKGRVLYLAMEGAAQLLKRADAWHGHHGLADNGDLVAYPLVVNFADVESVQGVADYVRAQRFDLVVVDTLARSMPGANENDTIDASSYVAQLSRIREANPASCVLTLHHSRKDEPTVPRGNTAIFAAMDTVICMRMDRRDSPSRWLEVQKSKEDLTGKDIHLSFEQVPPSAVLVEGQGGEHKVLLALKNLAASGTQITTSDFITELIGAGFYDKRDSASKAIRRLIADGQLQESDGLIQPGPGRPKPVSGGQANVRSWKGGNR